MLDCDPGHDDAIALLLAAGDPRIELLAVTTVAGNQTLEKVTRNALAVATIAGIDVPIAAGADRPLVRPQIVAPEIHGESGLDGPVLPEPSVALDPRHGVDLLVETVMAHEPGTVTLVPTGPLTNIALAMRLRPEIVDRVARVVLMGGAYTRGNKTPAAEFNIAADPEAAAGGVRRRRGTSPWSASTSPTRPPRTPPSSSGSPRSAPRSRAFVVDVLGFFASTYKQQQGFDAPPVHDPCCVAMIADPAVVETARRVRRRRARRDVDHRHDRHRLRRRLRPAAQHPRRDPARPRPLLGHDRRGDRRTLQRRSRVSVPTTPSMAPSIPVIFDCDTGIDDALALFYGAAHGAEYVACTVTHGNVPVDVGSRNTLTILEALGLDDVPVFTGAARPLAQPLRTVGVRARPGRARGRRRDAVRSGSPGISRPSRSCASPGSAPAS